MDPEQGAIEMNFKIVLNIQWLFFILFYGWCNGVVGGGDEGGIGGTGSSGNDYYNKVSTGMYKFSTVQERKELHRCSEWGRMREEYFLVFLSVLLVWSLSCRFRMGSVCSSRILLSDICYGFHAKTFSSYM